MVAIADGDTVTILDSANTQHRIRLEGIDAPESHQAFGTQSKKNLSEMIFGKDVTVVYQKTDQYGRLVGKIVLDGKDVNLEQVKAGMAWHYKEYEREQSPEDRDLYARAEDDARSARRGLWVDANPIEPGEFRRDQKRERDKHPQRSRGCVLVVLAAEGQLECDLEHRQQHERVEAVAPYQRPHAAREVRDTRCHVLKVDHRRQSVVVREDDFKIIRSDE